MSISNLVSLNKNCITTTSNIVAGVFKKQHKDVLRKVEALEIPDSFRKRNFTPTQENIKAGSVSRNSKAYKITKDGFVLLAMGFTGKKAMVFKIQYINAFNEMEAKLLKQQSLPAAPRHYIKSVIDAKLSVFNKDEQRQLYPQVWQRLKNKFYVTRYDDLTEQQVPDAIEYLLNMALQMPKDAEPLKVLPQRVLIENGRIKALNDHDVVANRRDLLEVKAATTNLMVQLKQLMQICNDVYQVQTVVLS